MISIRLRSKIGQLWQNFKNQLNKLIKSKRRTLKLETKEIPFKWRELHREQAKQYPTSKITNRNFQMESRIILEDKRKLCKRIFLRRKWRILWLILKKVKRCSKRNCWISHQFNYKMLCQISLISTMISLH